LDSFLIQFFRLVQEFFSPALGNLEKICIVAQTLGVLRENLEGVEITLFCCMVVSHARELISFFAQFEHF
jgi:hypothetical protein